MGGLCNFLNSLPPIFILFYFCFGIGKMVANKRSGGAISRSLNGNNRTCFAAREATKPLLSGLLLPLPFLLLSFSSFKYSELCCITFLYPDGLWDSKQGVWSKMSEQVALNLSKSIVSLVLSDGDCPILLFLLSNSMFKHCLL